MSELLDLLIVRDHVCTLDPQSQTLPFKPHNFNDKWIRRVDDERAPNFGSMGKRF